MTAAIVGYVTLTLMTFDKQSNGPRTAVESQLNRGCNDRISSTALVRVRIVCHAVGLLIVGAACQTVCRTSTTAIVPRTLRCPLIARREYQTQTQVWPARYGYADDQRLTETYHWLWQKRSSSDAVTMQQDTSTVRVLAAVYRATLSQNAMLCRFELFVHPSHSCIVSNGLRHLVNSKSWSHSNFSVGIKQAAGDSINHNFTAELVKLYRCHVYRVSKNTYHFYFYDNFDKSGPNFIFFTVKFRKNLREKLELKPPLPLKSAVALLSEKQVVNYTALHHS